MKDNPSGIHLTNNEINEQNGYRIVELNEEMDGYSECLSWYYQHYEDGSFIYFIPELFNLMFGYAWDGKREVYLKQIE